MLRIEVLARHKQQGLQKKFSILKKENFSEKKNTKITLKGMLGRRLIFFLLAMLYEKRLNLVQRFYYLGSIGLEPMTYCL
jgi:hypothetical protein